MHEQEFAIRLASDKRQGLSLELVENLLGLERAQTVGSDDSSSWIPHDRNRSLALQCFSNAEGRVPLNTLVGPPFMMIGIGPFLLDLSMTGRQGSLRDVRAESLRRAVTQFP